MRRPLALPLPNKRLNMLLCVPTTLCRCTKRRSMVRDYVPAQASLPAPTLWRLARPSLSIHTINVAVIKMEYTKYVKTPLWRRTQRRLVVRNYVPVHGMGSAPMRRPSALLLTNDTDHTRRDEYIAIYTIHVVKHNVPMYVPTTLCP